jgi:ligand-binding sensor domain-containing protein
LCADKHGNTWIGTQHGLFRYNGKSCSTVTTDFVSYIMEDKGGNIWIRTMKGVLRYDGKAFASFTE